MACFLTALKSLLKITFSVWSFLTPCSEYVLLPVMPYLLFFKVFDNYLKLYIYLLFDFLC